MSCTRGDKICTIGYKMFWSAQLKVTDSTDWHDHEVFELIFCGSGSGQVVIDNSSIDFRPERMILIIPNARHRFVLSREEAVDLKIVCITAQDTAMYLSPLQLAMLEDLRAQGCTFSDSADDIPPLAQLAKLIPDGSVIGAHSDLLLVWGVVSLLLAAHARSQGAALKEPKQRHQDKIHEVCAWLNEHVDEETNLDEIASRFGFSRSLLTRAFRQQTGTSVVDYVNARRLEKAAVLLTSSSDKAIVQTAYESGFSNLSNFHRRFKAAYGLTPAEFRRNFSR